jgi:hypothetical protein
MAGWITVFKAIPWADLVVAAPAVVKGAQKLWATVRKQDAPPVTGQGVAADQRALEEQLAELRQELAAASELVAKLAEQNNRLVAAIEVLRVRTRALFALAVATGIALAVLAIAAL